MTLSSRELGPDTSESDIAALIDAVKLAPSNRDVLINLLSETNPVYSGRSTNAVTRIWGYAMAAFEQVGLPDEGLPFVLSELESGRQAYLIAAAARALRGLPRPISEVAPFLLRAINNIKFVDDAITFETYSPGWPLTNRTTALDEIFETFRWLGPEARSARPVLASMKDDHVTFSPAIRQRIFTAIEAIDRETESLAVKESCCSERPVSGVSAPLFQVDLKEDVPFEVELEDQDARTLLYEDFFKGRPTILVWFYTRCPNPNKCSLTITKLARLQSRISDARLHEKLRTAAITYDPGFDLPSRLRVYGQNRGFAFDEHNRFFRAHTDFEVLTQFFELGVNFGPNLVNTHRIELFILDSSGAVATARTRLQWDEQDVLEQAVALLS